LYVRANGKPGSIVTTQYASKDQSRTSVAIRLPVEDIPNSTETKLMDTLDNTNVQKLKDICDALELDGLSPQIGIVIEGQLETDRFDKWHEEI